MRWRRRAPAPRLRVRTPSPKLPSKHARCVANDISERKQRNKYLVNFFLNESYNRSRTLYSTLKTLARVIAPPVTVSHEVHYKGNVV